MESPRRNKICNGFTLSVRVIRVCALAPMLLEVRGQLVRSVGIQLKLSDKVTESLHLLTSTDLNFIFEMLRIEPHGV